MGKRGGFWETCVDGCMYTPLQGCQMHYCVDHLSRIRKDGTRKTDEEMTSEETLYGLCMGCYDRKQSSCRWTRGLSWFIFWSLLLLFLFIAVPFCVWEFGVRYEKQAVENQMTGRNYEPGRVVCEEDELFCF